MVYYIYNFMQKRFDLEGGWPRITTRMWHWKSHWKVQPHWKTTETTLNSFTKDNHTEICCLIPLKIFSVTQILCTLNFQCYSGFSVWFSVSYSRSDIVIRLQKIDFDSFVEWHTSDPKIFYSMYWTSEYNTIHTF